jgi:hypothetical protein
VEETTFLMWIVIFQHPNSHFNCYFVNKSNIFKNEIELSYW